MMEAIAIGLLQGLGIIWIVFTLLLLMSCTPDRWDAPISRYYPWWCAGWPLLILFGIGCAVAALFCLGMDAVTEWLKRLPRLFTPKPGPPVHTVPWMPGYTEMPAGVVWALKGIERMSAAGEPYPGIAVSMHRTLGLDPERCQYYVTMAARLGLLRDVLVFEQHTGCRSEGEACATANVP
jgi:hypothetical protein